MFGFLSDMPLANVYYRALFKLIDYVYSFIHECRNCICYMISFIQCVFAGIFKQCVTEHFHTKKMKLYLFGQRPTLSGATVAFLWS